jgi:hypothetical protein
MMTLPIRRNDPARNRLHNRAGLAAGLALCLIAQSTPTTAVPILNDPNGFEDIPWGTTLSDQDRFVKIEDTGRFQAYELKERPPKLGPTPVDSMRFATFQNRFGRVIVRYGGHASHEAILAYLQSIYGLLDRTPGQIAVGPVKVYAWHGIHTEVTLRFESNLDRGIIFFESRTLRERWSEESPSTVF